MNKKIIAEIKWIFKILIYKQRTLWTTPTYQQMLLQNLKVYKEKKSYI